jgi:hypothetical protein
VTLIEAIRILGFGAALGAGVGAWCYFLWPHAFPALRAVQDALLAGALLGGGLSQFIDKYLIGWILAPAYRQAAFYLSLLQLWTLTPVTSSRLRAQLTKKLVEKHFIDGK